MPWFRYIGFAKRPINDKNGCQNTLSMLEIFKINYFYHSQSKKRMSSYQKWEFFSIGHSKVKLTFYEPPLVNAVCEWPQIII